MAFLALSAHLTLRPTVCSSAQIEHVRGKLAAASCEETVKLPVTSPKVQH